jgi:thiosulfate reductase cytochrome b subunit
MSPAMDSAFPWLVPLFHGRQSARTVHFVLAACLVAFVVVHLVMVLVSGVFNNMRSMITGRYRIEEDVR